jgi:hypothetical protein
MGADIYFRYCPAPEAICGSMLFDDEEFAQDLGRAHFAAGVDQGQQHFYGVSWSDCLTYRLNGEDVLGAPDDEDIGGWYTPDWDNALVKLEELLAAWERTKNAHRKEYDAIRLPEFARLVRLCATHPDSSNCQVNISI